MEMRETPYAHLAIVNSTSALGKGGQAFSRNSKQFLRNFLRIRGGGFTNRRLQPRRAASLQRTTSNPKKRASMALTSDRSIKIVLPACNALRKLSMARSI